jgi:hypothetical protein
MIPYVLNAKPYQTLCPQIPGKCQQKHVPEKCPPPPLNGLNLYKFHATFLTQNHVANVPPANPRQITGFDFDVKQPTKTQNTLKSNKIV